MRILFFLSLLTLNVARAEFLPQSFRTNFEQKYKSIISGKEKISLGAMDYSYPGKIRFEITNPEQTIFVSDAKTSWYYTAPFDPKEKGEVIIQDSNKLLITKFFDTLKKGLITNTSYTVEKNDKGYVLQFSEKVSKELNIFKAQLISEVKDLKKLSEIKEIILFYKDKKEVKLTFSSFIENVKFDSSYFNFKIPQNTKEIRQ